jgi:hypothetical protein
VERVRGREYGPSSVSNEGNWECWAAVDEVSIGRKMKGET